MTEKENAAIARIDERTEGLVRELSEIRSKLDSHFVTKDEYRPVRMLVYGLVSLMLTTLILSLLAYVIQGPV